MVLDPGALLGLVELPLEELAGTTVAGLELTVEVEAGSSGPYPVTITARSDEATWPILRGQTNPGTAWRHPWLEVRFDPEPPTGKPLSEAEQIEVFEHLAEVALLPGSYVMVSCDGHRETLEALTVDIPPPCTWVGYLLWRAGARWYKVWYYPEGWREGNEKLQGNLPTDEEHAAKRTRQRLDEVEAFLDTELAETFPACAERGRALLDAHVGGSGGGSTDAPT